MTSLLDDVIIEKLNFLILLSFSWILMQFAYHKTFRLFVIIAYKATTDNILGCRISSFVFMEHVTLIHGIALKN